MKEKNIYINGVLTKYTITKNGEVYSYYNKKRHKLKWCKNSSGYYCVNLYIDKKLYRQYVHRLVAISFISVPNKYLNKGYNINNLEVNHKNGNKSDNCVNNLEWNTSKENTNHAFSTKLRKIEYGENATDAKISNELANKICMMLEDNKYGVREISEKLQIPSSIVNNIKHKKSWLHISKNYDIDNHTKRSSPKKSKRKPSIKISVQDATTICELLEDNSLSVKEISKMLNITKCKVNSILYGSAWTEVSRKYDFSKRRRK